MLNTFRVALFGFAASLIYGQTPNTPPADADLMCVGRLELPSYPLLAQQARIEGTVSADIVLSTAGSIRDVNVHDGANPSATTRGVLLKAVSDAVRAAEFERSCAGRTVRIVFIFELAGTSSGRPRQTLAFGTPNKFWIRSEAPHWQP
jgi:hypothetical protein